MSTTAPLSAAARKEASRASPAPRVSTAAAFSSLASSPSWRRQRYSRRAPGPRSPCVMAHSPSALFGVKCPSCPKQACAKGASHVRHPDPPRPRRLREISESTQRAPTWVLTSGACARLLDRGASCSWQRGSRARRHRRNHIRLTVTSFAGLAVVRTKTTGQWKI